MRSKGSAAALHQLRECTSCDCQGARPQVWNLTNCKLRSDLRGHTGYINTVTVSPDGSLCASGGKVRPRPARAAAPLPASLLSASAYLGGSSTASVPPISTLP